MPGNWGLIDKDTPESEYYRRGFFDPNDEWQLIFSDEFNQEGRTFWPGDDPYWEAVDLHYWETNNLEWYDPAAIMTQGGDLVITLSQKATHNLNYQGGEGRAPVASTEPSPTECVRPRHDVDVEQVLLHGRVHRDQRVVTGSEQHPRTVARHLDDGQLGPCRLRCQSRGNGQSHHSYYFVR